MNKIKAYLYTIECVDENYCEFNVDNKIYVNRENAINALKEDVEAFEKNKGPERNGYDFTIKAEDGSSVIYQKEYDSPTHFCNHQSFKVQEIELEDGEDISFVNEDFEQNGAIVSSEDYIKEQISEIFESVTDKNPEDYKNLIETMTNTVMYDDHFWDDFNSSLMDIMHNNPDYEKLAEEYSDNIALQGGF